MQPDYDLRKLLAFLQINDGDRPARADAMFVDQRIGARGFGRLLAGFEFSDDQRRNVEQLLDAWERQSA